MSQQRSKLKSIFYARFHSERGPVILRQCPRLGIFASPRFHDDAQLIQFSDISSYIIPPYELCNNALSVATNGYSILGLPVSIEDPKYPRNRFTFNVCFVLEDALDENERRAWNTLVRKTAKWFRGIEEGDALLSSINEDNDPAGQDSVDVLSSILEQVYQQLTDYSECCVAASDTYVLNLCLDIHKVPKETTIHAWDVPVLVADLPDQETTTWDLVLQQVHHHVNGVNHIRKIAELADVELDLVLSTVQVLVNAELAMTIDIFHFQAAYAATADLAFFIKDEKLLAECQHYITREGGAAMSTDAMVDLYLGLQPGLTIGEYCLAQQDSLRTIDIRRMITFGVIKGFLRRVHRYAQLSESASSQEPASRPVTSMRDNYDDALRSHEQAWKQAALSSGWATPPTDMSASLKTRARKTEEQVRFEADEKLRTFLDGRHCFDQICVEMGLSEKQVMERLKSDRFGEVTIFMR